MRALRNRLARLGQGERGLTLAEVIVAMMIFSLVALGVGYSLVMVLHMTNDARGKQTATNLAAAEIDTARAAATLSGLSSHTNTVVVDGRDYKVAVQTRWVGSIGGADGLCSSGTGALLYKRVNVSVTWEGMSAGAAPVVTDTVVAPSVRVNDADKGVIVVAVNDVAGVGNAGVKVTAVPSAVPNGAVALTTAPSPTDQQGCAVILNVKPGNYDVSISRPGALIPSVDSITQQAIPSLKVEVIAGASAFAPFQYDVASIFTLKYASNYVGAVTLPNSLDKTFATDNRIYVTTAAAPFYLHPYPSGYSVIAGKLAASGSSVSSCSSVDPAAWPAATVGGTDVVGVRMPPAASQPGQAPVSPLPVVSPVPMGVVQIASLARNTYVKATGQKTGPGGDPGCSTPSTYVFGPLATGTATLALPFGTWELRQGTSATAQTSNVDDKATTLKTAGVMGKVSGTVVVTMDPRVPAAVAP